MKNLTVVASLLLASALALLAGCGGSSGPDALPSPAPLSAGKADPVVKFFNAQMAFDDFTSRGLTNVSLVDVDSKISQAFGSLLAADPVAYFTAYHGTYDAQFCTQVAKAFFALLSRQAQNGAFFLLRW